MERIGDGFALITGASRGIGRALAEECAKRGWDLALVALPGEDLVITCAEIASKFGVQAKFLEMSLADADAPQQVLAWVQAEQMRVSMLINNAGLGTSGPLIETHPAKQEAMLYLNMHTPFGLILKLLPMLQAQKQAYIINIASQAAFFPIPYKATYSATKAFLYYLSQALAFELKGSNVHVSVVCPSGVKTSPAIRQRIETAGPLARMVALEPEEVAEITIRKSLRKKSFIVPGRLNMLSFYLNRLTPDFVKMSFIAKKIKKNPVE